MEKKGVRKGERAEGPDMKKSVEAYLQSQLPGIFRALARKITIPQLIAASGSISDIDINKIILGEAKIDKVTLQDTSATVQSGSAYLQNVRINLELKFTLDWWVDIWVYSDSGTEDLGSIWFPVSIGDVRVPSLEDIHLSIPSMTTQNIKANMPPISNLDLKAGNFTNLQATETTIPADGFQLSGLGLGNFSLSNLQVPKTFTREASLQQFQPQAELVLPSAQMTQVSIPSASANNIQSNAIALDGVASKRGLSISFGIFGVTIWVQPVAHMSIGSMVLSDVKISALVNQARIENVRIPVDIRGISLKGIEIRELNINNMQG